jgi:hypothetical protein
MTGNYSFGGNHLVFEGDILRPGGKLSPMTGSDSFGGNRLVFEGIIL